MDDPIVYAVISSLKRGTTGGRPRPHKPVMWLAVLSLFDEGYIAENKIFYNDVLTNEFESIFPNYSQGDDLAQAAPPYFHLRSSNIWHHSIKRGEEEYYASLTTSGGGSKRIARAIEFVYLDDDVYTFLTNIASREKLREALVFSMTSNNRG